MSGPLGVVQALQRAAHAVAAGQRGAAAARLRRLPCRLVLKQAQRVRLGRLGNQTASTNRRRTRAASPGGCSAYLLWVAGRSGSCLGSSSGQDTRSGDLMSAALLALGCELWRLSPEALGSTQNLKREPSSAQSRPGWTSPGWAPPYMLAGRRSWNSTCSSGRKAVLQKGQVVLRLESSAVQPAMISSS